MRKCVVFGGIAAALAFAPAGAVCAAGDYEAPSGIELSIDDIHVDRADLSGGKLVEVPVCIGNNSGFVSVKMLIQLDSRLSFAEDYELGTRAENMAGVHISEQKDMENTRKVNFVTKSKSRFTENGEIGFVRVMLPEDIPDGRCDISVYPYTDEPMILTYNNFDAYFGAECFFQLKGGSIIVGDAEEEPRREQAAPQNAENAVRNDTPQESSLTDNNDGESETAAAVTTSAAAVTTAQTTTKNKTKTTVTSETSSTVTTSGTSEVTTSTETTVVSAVSTEPVAETENTRRKGKDLLLPVIIASVIALGTACFIVRKGGRSK